MGGRCGEKRCGDRGHEKQNKQERDAIKTWEGRTGEPRRGEVMVCGSREANGTVGHFFVV